jgi:hypothetical protein
LTEGKRKYLIGNFKKVHWIEKKLKFIYSIEKNYTVGVLPTSVIIPNFKCCLFSLELILVFLLINALTLDSYSQMEWGSQNSGMWHYASTPLVRKHHNLTSICTVIFVETIAFSLLLFFNQPIVEITFLGLPLSLFFTLGYYLLLVLLAMWSSNKNVKCNIWVHLISPTSSCNMHSILVIGLGHCRDLDINIGVIKWSFLMNFYCFLFLLEQRKQPLWSYWILCTAIH